MYNQNFEIIFNHSYDILVYVIEKIKNSSFQKMFCSRKSAYYEQCNQSLNFMQITCSIIYADSCK